MDRRSGRFVIYAMLVVSAVGALAAAGQRHTLRVLTGVPTFSMD